MADPHPIPASVKALFKAEAAKLLDCPTGATIAAQIERSFENKLDALQVVQTKSSAYLMKAKGDREYFPQALKIGRSTKHARDADTDDSEIDESPSIKSRNRKSNASVKKAPKLSPATPDTDGPKERPTPPAPQKYRRQVPSGEDILSALLSRLESKAAMRERIGEANGMGMRNTRASKLGYQPIAEVETDDTEHFELESLCGMIVGLDMRSAIDAGELSIGKICPRRHIR